jgi:Outer membrane protein beta-barrel domain
MNIRTILLSGALLMVGFGALSQDNQKVSFGIRGGFGYQNINGDDQRGNKLEFDMVPRYNVGIVLEIPLANQFFVQPSLLYATKGAKTNNNYLNLDMSSDVNLGYLELPVNFVYKPTLGKGNLIVGIGPYIAYGIGGQIEYNRDGISTEEDIEFTDEYSTDILTDQKYYKPLDYGGNIMFGYQFAGGLSAQLNAQLGMADIRAENTMQPNSQAIFKNTGFGISLGYLFNK